MKWHNRYCCANAILWKVAHVIISLCISFLINCGSCATLVGQQQLSAGKFRVDLVLPHKELHLFFQEYGHWKQTTWRLLLFLAIINIHKLRGSLNYSSSYVQWNRLYILENSNKSWNFNLWWLIHSKHLKLCNLFESRQCQTSVHLSCYVFEIISMHFGSFCIYDIFCHYFVSVIPSFILWNNFLLCYRTSKTGLWSGQ